MKPTVKVSIGKYAFNLEEDAFQIIDDYLKTLSKCFANNPEGSEIIQDVEIRMAELLQMRQATVNSVIVENDAKAVIAIMGNPKDFGEGEVNEGDTTFAMDEISRKKKLYRDPDFGVVGGVCSGLGYYFNVDPTIIRILIVATFFASVFFGQGGIGGFVLLGYLILWVAMPKAKTFVQKLNMTGAASSIEDIQRGNLINSTRPKKSKAVKVIASIIAGIICFCILSVVVVIVATIFGFYWGRDFPDMSIFLGAYDIYTTKLKIAILLVACLPLLGFLYLGVKFLLQSKFTRRSLIFSCVIFLMWLGSIFYTGGSLSGVFRHYTSNVSAMQDISIDTASDTLYLKLGEQYLNSSSAFDDSEALAFNYIEENEKGHLLFFKPRIIVKHDSSVETFKIELEKKAFDKNRRLAQMHAEKAKLDYTINDSLIIINPQLYNKKHLWNREFFKLIVIVPTGKEVVVDPELESKLIYFNK